MDRRLLILMRLREERAVTAQALAETCECSVRTVYRDVDALCAAGVPIAAMPGEGYRIVPGYHLPPIAFTAEEATQLLLGADLAPPLGTDDQRAAARSAAAKVEAALDAPTREQVQHRRERLAAMPDGRAAPSPWLPVLVQAVLEDRVVHLRYHAYESDAVTERDVEPHRMYYGEDWYLVGHCRLRGDERMFRASRVREARLLDEHVPPPRPPRRDRARNKPEVDVHVWLAASVLPWAREQPCWGFEREEPAEDGAVFHFRVRDWRDVMPWALRWGASARVLSPPGAITRMRDEIAALARVYDS